MFQLAYVIEIGLSKGQTHQTVISVISASQSINPSSRRGLVVHEVPNGYQELLCLLLLVVLLIFCSCFAGLLLGCCWCAAGLLAVVCSYTAFWYLYFVNYLYSLPLTI